MEIVLKVVAAVVALVLVLIVMTAVLYGIVGLIKRGGVGARKPAAHRGSAPPEPGRGSNGGEANN